MIIFKTKELREAFKDVSPAVEQNPILPILKYVRCSIEKKVATIRGTNLKLDILVTLAVESQDCVFLLPFAQINNQLPTLKSDLLVFEINGLQVKMTGIKNFEFTTMEENNFPALVPTGETFSLRVGDDYVQSMKEAVRHRSINDTHVSFYGLCLSGCDIVCTDSGQAYLRTLDYDVKGSYHVQPLFVESLYSMPAILELNEKFISAKQANKTTRCTLFEQKFVNYKMFVPKEPVWNVAITATDLLDNIESVVAFGDRTAECTFTFLKDKIALSYSNPLEANSFYIEMECEHSVEIKEMSFVAATLKSIIKDSGELLSLAITEERKPMYISSEKEGILNFIMPSFKLV